MNWKKILEFIILFILSCFVCCCVVAVIIGSVVWICLLVNFNVYVTGAVIIGTCGLIMTIQVMKEN